MKKAARRKKNPKRVLRLPDLDYAKGAVLNTLGSPASKRAYEFAIDDFVNWYCSEPRLTFSKTVVLRCRIELEYRHLARATINLRLAAAISLRSCRYGTAQPGTGGGHPAREGGQTNRRAARELVDGGTVPSLAPGSRRPAT